MIELEMQSIRSADSDGAPVRGGSGREDMLLSKSVRREELERMLKQARIWVAFVNAALSILDNMTREFPENFRVGATA